MTNMNDQHFDIDIVLTDYRGNQEVAPDMQALRYRATIKHGDKHTAVWSQRLEDDEIGTRQAFINMLDGLSHAILNRLCPNEPPSIPPTK